MSNASLKISTKRLEAQLDKLEEKFETEISRWRKKIRVSNLKTARRHLNKKRKKKR